MHIPNNGAATLRMNSAVLVTTGHIVSLANELKATFVRSNNDNAMNTAITFTKTTYTNDMGVKYDAKVATIEEAQALAAEFPKSCKVWATTLSGCGDAKAVVLFSVMYPASNKGMGDANETGSARERSFLKHLKRMSIEVAE